MVASLKQLFAHPYNRQRPAFAFFRWVLWKLIRVFRLKNLKVKVWGNRFLLLNHDSFQSMWIMYNWIVDWEEFRLIEHYLRHDDRVFDIGTNMGFYTVWMSRFIDQTGKIHCFEPDGKNYKRLESNISLNQLAGFTKSNQCAVSDHEGLLMFTEGRDGENHISYSELESAVKVQSVTLDKYVVLQGIKQIAYMKIDVEGFELHVLKGAVELLKHKQVDIIQLEINQQLNNAGTTVNDLVHFLYSYGYTLHKYDVSSRFLMPVQYTQQRENYFAIADIQKVNSRIRKH